MLASATGLSTTELKGDPITSVSAPLPSTTNTEIVFDTSGGLAAAATNRRPPEASVVTKDGPGRPTAKGEPGTGFSAPELSIENADISLESRLAVYKNAPEGCMRMLTGFVPVATGAPTGVSCPELPMLKAATVFATESATNRKLPLGCIAIAEGFMPANTVVGGTVGGFGANDPVRSKV